MIAMSKLLEDKVIVFEKEKFRTKLTYFSPQSDNSRHLCLYPCDAGRSDASEYHHDDGIGIVHTMEVMCWIGYA